MVEILRKHKEAIAWSEEDLKGTSSSICMHKILMEENAKTFIENQRRLNPVMKEVVKKGGSQMAKCRIYICHIRQPLGESSPCSSKEVRFHSYQK